MKKYVIGFFKYLFYLKVSKLAFITSDSLISKKSRINRFSKVFSSSISDYSYVGERSEIVNTSIGKFCSIANGCIIGLANHTSKNISTSPIFTERNNGTGFCWINFDVVNKKSSIIKIGNDVWIGSRVIIISKEPILTIGDGAIIGAGSIVTRDIPPYAIVAGIPARILKYRFNSEIINKLIELNWWSLSEKELKKKIFLFQNNNITIEFLEELKS